MPIDCAIEVTICLLICAIEVKICLLICAIEVKIRLLICAIEVTIRLLICATEVTISLNKYQESRADICGRNAEPKWEHQRVQRNSQRGLSFPFN